MRYQTVSWDVSLDDDDDELRRIVSTYKQPVKDRLKYLAFHYTACQLPWKLVDWFDAKTLGKRHRRHCNDDCADFISVHDNNDVVKGCGRMPLSTNWDCLCYSLQVRNQYDVKRL